MSVSPHDRRTGANAAVRERSFFSGLRRSCECGLFYFSWILFGILSLIWNLMAAILYLVLPRGLAHPIGRTVIAYGFRAFIGFLRFCGLVQCDLSALKSLAGESSLIIAPNHPGRLDAFLMISQLPRAVCIVKAPLWRNPFLGAGARCAGYVRNDAPMTMIKIAAQEVVAGRSLLIFPEGTRTAESTVGPFRGGFALIAKRANAPVQTVFIENPSGYLGKGWPSFQRPAFPLVFRVRLGRRFIVPDKVEAFVAELERYFCEELASGRKTAMSV